MRAIAPRLWRSRRRCPRSLPSAAATPSRAEGGSPRARSSPGAHCLKLGAHALQPRQLGLDAHPLPAEGDDVLVLALDLALLGLQLLEAGAASDVPVAVQLLAREPVDGVSDAHANVTPANPVPLTLLMASGIRPNRVEMYWKATTLTVKTPESTRGYARNTTGPT